MEKAEGLFRLRLNGIMDIFNLYGMGIYIPIVKDKIVEAAKQYSMDLENLKAESKELAEGVGDSMACSLSR